MRLTNFEKNGIITALEQYANNAKLSLFLYGSRTDINKKGGDIDLLIITQDEETKKLLNLVKHSILATIKSYIGDQRIDLKIAKITDINSDSFLKMIYPDTCIKLHEWN